jgi:hypothetical protein
VKRTRNLVQAVDAGDLQLVRALLDQGVNPNTPDKHGLPPLHVAAYIGHRDLVEALVSAGADVHAKDKFGRTPLLHAVAGGHKSIVVYLLLNMAEVRSPTNSGLSPFTLAEAQGDKELASLLRLASKVDLEAVRRLARSLANTPSQASERPDPLVTALLEEMGIDVQIEPLVTALLDELRRGRRGRSDRSTSSNPGLESSGQAYPISQVSSTRRTDHFCGVPVESVRHGRSWVVSGTDPSVISGDYAFIEFSDYSTIFNQAFIELDSLALEGSRSAFDVFNQYFRRIGQAKKISEYRCTLQAALMLYTDDRFYRALNGCWRNNRSNALYGFSALMMLAFDDAPYFIKGEVYRGVDLSDITRYTPGLVFRWPFFVSASTNRAIASQFGKTSFVIEVPASGNVREIAHCSLCPDEGEVLFYPYEVFEVLEAGATGVRVKISDDIFFGLPGVQETELGGGAKQYTFESSRKKQHRRNTKAK